MHDDAQPSTQEHANPFRHTRPCVTHRPLVLLQASFTRIKLVCTHTLLAADILYTQTLLHTDPFTQTTFRHTDPSNTQTLLHMHDAFTAHDALTHATLSHTDAFTHRCFSTQALLHTDPFIHKRFYTQTLLHTDACTHNWNRNFTSVFDTRTSFCAWRVHPAHTEIAILPQFLTLEPRFVREGFIRHTWNRNFTSVFDTRTSFCAWRVHPAHLKSQFYLSFWHSNLVLCVKGWRFHSAHLKSQFYLSVWHSNLVLCVKGSSGTLEIAILPQFLTLEPRFVRKGWRFHSARLKSQFYLSFWHSNLVLCVKGSSGTLEIAILPQFLTLEPRFVREGFIRHTCNRNFTTVLDTRTSFRA